MEYLFPSDEIVLCLGDKMTRICVNDGLVKPFITRGGAKQQDRNKILVFSKISENAVLLYCQDYCLKVHVFEDGKEEKYTILGFLCPYCHMICQKLVNLFVQHIDVHQGPVICASCQVEDAYFFNNFFNVYSRKS